MRPRFASAALLLVLASASAPAFDRTPIQPGDTATGDILVPFTFDEFPIRVAGGSVLAIAISSAGARPFKPALGLYTDDYSAVSLVGTGPTNVRSENALSSAQYRIIVGGNGGAVGAYRLGVSVKPQTAFTISGTDATPAPTLTFGAFPGFAATIAVQWKGAAPVTLTSVTGPDGAALTSAAAPRSSKSSFTQGGFTTTALGDHVAAFAVPAGTKSWKATVRLAGKLPKGRNLDVRTADPSAPQTVAFPSSGRFPIATVADEVGGPNDCALATSSDVPDATFLVGAGGAGDCSRTPKDAATPPTTYLLGCTDGFFVDAGDVERYADGPWKGWVKSYAAKSVRSPQGSGSSTLSDFTYDAVGRPTGWTEVRHFDASGRDHRLTFSSAEYFFGSGLCKGFRVAESLLVGGAPVYTHVVDYAPFR